MAVQHSNLLKRARPSPREHFIAPFEKSGITRTLTSICVDSSLSSPDRY